MPILTPSERLGTRVAEKYELLSILGRGGMGVVYEALHVWTGRRVAVKLIDPNLADDPEQIARFLNEARAATRLAHPHVVEVLDMGRGADGCVYQALELLEGETLRDHLRREGKLTVSDTVQILMPIMDALTCAHARGIVHRDVKPDNIFLQRTDTPTPRPVLLDFGIAKLLEGQPLTTHSSAVLGTPYYMAPEQALGSRTTGPAADVWAMGTILFECLTGQLPFGEGPSAAYIARVLYESAPSLATRVPLCPSHVVAAVDQALTRDPGLRQPTMEGLKHALVDSLHSRGVVRSPVATGRRGLTRLALAAMLAFAGAGLGLLMISTDTARHSGAPLATPAQPTANAEKPHHRGPTGKHGAVKALTIGLVHAAPPVAQDKAPAQGSLAVPPTEINPTRARPPRPARRPAVAAKRAVRVEADAGAAGSSPAPTTLPPGMTESF